MKLTRDLKEFIELLNAHHVEYLLIGGWAFGFHATPRYTGDIDFFLRCDEANATRLKKTLTEFGFAELPGFEESFLQPDRILQFGLPPNRIDILTQISGVNFTEAWESHVQGELEGLPVPIISREKLIKNKETAARAKDLADIEALQKTTPRNAAGQ
jgi:hypothetical protein